MHTPLTKAQRQARTAAQPKCTVCGQCASQYGCQNGYQMCNRHYEEAQARYRASQEQAAHCREKERRIAQWRQDLYEAQSNRDLNMLCKVVESLIDHIEEQP